jgi:signal transduction histidine kinase
VLGTSLDSETTIAAVARLAVPAIADWCVVDLAEPRGDGAFRLRRLSAVHADPAKQANMGELLARYPSLEPEVGHTARRVFESGESWLDPSVDEARFVAEARDAAHLELLRTLGFAGEIVVPLVARGQALGTITLVTGPGRRRYDQADRALAEELARRCAIALDNARLYAEARAAVQARDNFLGIAAHEMRTPITGLRGYAQLVIRQLDQDGRADPARVRRGLDEIERQSRRLTELMARLLDVARIETGKLAIEPRPTDLGALVEQVVENVRQMAPDRALSVRASGPIEASIDPLRFEQVIRNLLDNAVKFSPVNAPIEIELHSGGRPDGDSGRSRPRARRGPGATG